STDTEGDVEHRVEDDYEALGEELDQEGGGGDGVSNSTMTKGKDGLDAKAIGSALGALQGSDGKYRKSDEDKSLEGLVGDGEADVGKPGKSLEGLDAENGGDDRSQYVVDEIGQEKSLLEKLNYEYEKLKEQLAINFATTNAQLANEATGFLEFLNGALTTGTPTYAITLNIMRQRGDITESQYQQLNAPGYRQMGGNFVGGLFALVGPGVVTRGARVVVNSVVASKSVMVTVNGRNVPVLIQRVATDLAGGTKFIIKGPGITTPIVLTEAQVYGTGTTLMTTLGGSLGTLPANPKSK
ncbi:MAG: hypothetical protein ACMG6S_12305, partial [Byssovorax sp.]